MRSHREILDLWPSQAALSGDLREEGVEIGVSGVGMWRVRNDIPPDNYPAIVRAAATRGFGLTLEELHEFRESSRVAP